VAAQLAEAFDLLVRHVPAAHRELGRRLGRVRVRIGVDDERFDVTAHDGVLCVNEVEGDESVSIDTSRTVIADVLGGRRRLSDALRDDTLRARGALRDLVAVLSALEAFVQGAVRCSGMTALFDAFQRERVA
jgi:hypothetical protein